MKRLPSSWIPALAVAAALAFPAATWAAPTYTLDFNDVDIRKVIETVSSITGRNFLIDDRIQGRVTVIGPKALTSAEVYQVFLAILQVKGFAMIPAGKIDKIVPAANMSGSGVDMSIGKAPEESDLDRYVTQIIPLEYGDSEELKNLLAPLMPKTDSIISYRPTNILIVTTTESIISRLNRIISVVDVPGAREEIRIIMVQNAQAQDLASKVTQVIESQARGAAPVQRAARGQQPGQTAPATETRIIADERTNSIIAIADTLTLDRIEDLVRRLDVAVPQGAGKINVYYLQYADAGELAKVLSGIPVEKSVASPETPPQPGQPPVQAPRPAAAAKSEISIIADISTNALVITATPEEYSALKAVIDKLDIPREQVLVEVLIAEVSFTKTMQLGVEWRVAKDYDGDFVGFAGSGFGDFDQLALSFPSVPSGLVIGAIGETITFGDLEFPSLGALIRALKTDSEVNILSTPTIVTTDNREAEIVVGQTVPFQTSQKFDSNNQPIYTFDYRDVGLTLRLTPQINKDGFIKMDIFSQLEALVSNALGTQELAPTTLKRMANTSVVVKDGNTVVLGGMIRDDKVENVSRVPILGSLPLLGPFFRSTSTRSEKTNLLIFMTPHIMSTTEAMMDAAKKRAGSLSNLPEETLESLGIGEESPEGTDGTAVPTPVPGRD